jgi:hypothetical protein
MSAPAPLVIGGVPRVDLLPPEVHAARRRKRDRRIAVIVFGAVVLLTLAGIGGAFALSRAAEESFATAQARTGDLLLEQASLSDIRVLHDSLDLTQAGLEVSSATDVDWVALTQSVLDTSPFVAPEPAAALVAPDTSIVVDLVTRPGTAGAAMTRLDVASVLDRIDAIEGVVRSRSTPLRWDPTADAYGVTITVAFDDVNTDRFATEGD